jgi:hypothetical protein
MIWLRKGVVHLLSLILLSALLTGTLAASIDIAFSHPAKLEDWLSQSGLYSSFVNDAIKQASNSTNNGQSSGVSLNDVAVQQAAQAAFSPTLLQQDVNTVLNSNYAWLQGKTTTPNFLINLSAAKTDFAQKVGQYAEAHLASLPVCTNAQLVATEQQLNNDPLSVTCRPASVSPAAEGASVTQQLQNGSGFLSNPVITAKSINPNGGNAAQPYYQKLSFAPRAYRAATQLPWAFGGLAVLCIVGIVFIAPRKRRGLRRVGYVLLVAGILLVAMKFVIDSLFKRFESTAFNNSSIGPLQQALTSFAHRVETQLVNVNMYFGIAFAVLAVAIFITLILSRNRNTSISLRPAKTAATTKANAAPLSETTDNSATTPPDKASKPKRPRLIQ